MHRCWQPSSGCAPGGRCRHLLPRLQCRLLLLQLFKHLYRLPCRIQLLWRPQPAYRLRSRHLSRYIWRERRVHLVSCWHWVGGWCRNLSAMPHPAAARQRCLHCLLCWPDFGRNIVQHVPVQLLRVDHLGRLRALLPWVCVPLPNGRQANEVRLGNVCQRCYGNLRHLRGRVRLSFNGSRLPSHQHVRLTLRLPAWYLLHFRFELLCVLPPHEVLP